MADNQQIVVPFILRQLGAKGSVSPTDIVGLSDAAGNILLKTSIQQLVLGSGVSYDNENYKGAFTPSQEAPSNPDNKPIWGDVSNTTSSDQTFINFLTNTPNGSGGYLPVVVPAGKYGKLSFNGTSWSFVEGTADLSGLATKQEAVLGTDLELVGENLMNGASILTDKYVNSSGLIAPGTGYKTAVITLDDSKTQITIDGVNLDDLPIHKYYLFNSDPIVYGFLDVMSKTLTIQPGATTLTFTAKEVNETDSVLDNIIVQYGTQIEDYGINKIKNNVIYNPGYKKADADNKFAAKISLQPYLDNINIETLPTTNLLNPETITDRALLNTANGQVITNIDKYYVTDFILVGRLKDYTMLDLDYPQYGYRNAVFYNSLKQFVSAIDSSSLATEITSLDNDGYYVRFSIPNSTHPTAPNNPFNVGLFEGDSPTWEKYKNVSIELASNQETAEKTENSIATISDINTIVNESSNNSDLPTLGYELDVNGRLTLTYPEGTISALIRNSRGNTGNDMLNFGFFALKGQGTNASDDVAPVHEQNTTIGANHGVVIAQFTATAHGLTNADIGSAWTKDGVTSYLMLVIDANTVLMLGENLGTIESPSFAPLSSGIFTRVSDSSSLTLSNYVTSQLYPTIKNLQSRVMVNGVLAMGATGSGTANFVDVVESYDIKLVASMLQNVIDNPGGGDLTFDGDVSTSIKNIYRFLPNMATLVIAEYRKITPTAFVDWMVTQSNCTIGPLTGTYYYMPNSSPINDSIDLRKPVIVPWSTSIPSGLVLNDHQPDPDNPPNRLVMSYNNLAYMIGYLPKRAVSKALNNYTHATFEMRNNTGKGYPHAVDSVRTNSVLPANATFNAIMMRVYTDLTKTRKDNRLWYFNFNFEGIEYLFVDYSGSMYDKIDLGYPTLNGKEIEVVESSNAEVLTDTYSDGISINATYVEGQTCYAVLMIY